MKPFFFAAPIALFAFGCFQDIVDDTDPTDTVASETPIVPAATGDTEPTSGSSSGTSDEGTDDEASATGPDPRCGDGTLDPSESCDDGNDRSGDGCSSTCNMESRACGRQAIILGQDIERGIGVCRDRLGETCEEDFAGLCAPGWHLCSWTEHTTLNDGVDIQLDDVAAVGVVRCRTLGGAGHYTSHDFSVDGPDSCEIGSSRRDCPTNLGCNETELSALCCAPVPSCGNGVVDDRLEECDDGNADDFDDCSNNCASRLGSGPFC